MKKRWIIWGVMGLALGLAAPAAAASSTVIFTAPASNSNVGQTIVLKGRVSPAQRCGLGSFEVSGKQGGGIATTPSSGNSLSDQDTGGNFTAVVNTSSALLNPATGVAYQPPRYIQPGLVTFTIANQGGSTCPTASLTLNYQPAATASPAKPTPTLAPTPSPSPTSTLTPSPLPVAAATNLPAWAVILLAALAGAGVLALAEVSGLEYVRRHQPKRPAKKSARKARKK